MLFLNNYLNKNRIKIFDLNTVENENTVKAILKHCPWVIVSWLLLQLFGKFFLTELYLHLYFSFNV